MRVTIVSAALFCLLAYGNCSWAADTTANEQSIFPEKIASRSESLPLPATNIRAELTQQLMELAMADVDPVFTHAWLQLTHESGRATDPETYFRIYTLLKEFRQHWYALSLEKREHLQIGTFNPIFTNANRHAYEALLQSHDVARQVDKLRPHAGNYLNSRKVLLSLLDEARKSAWPELKTAKLQPGDSSDQLPAIRDILIRSGDLSSSLFTAESLQEQSYDTATEDGVKHFQLRHGLDSDGVIGRRTLYWLRMPPYERAVILARSLLRSDIPLSAEQQQTYVLVNIPEYQMRVVDRETVVFRSKVIVGRAQRQTPIMASHISSVILNPAWHVPSTILKKDLIPKLAKDKNLLDKENFEIINAQGETVNPSEIVWDDADNNFPYKLRQKPGDHNALGRYKFYLPNNDEIYLHSTSTPAYFKLNLRALSSGCVRVQDADAFAQLLLKYQWTPEKIEAMLDQEKTKWLPISNPLPVYMVYWRSWVDNEGVPQFRDDIYDFDADAPMVNNAVLKSIIGHS